MEILLTILINSAAFYLGAKFLDGVTISRFVHAIAVAVVIALLNVTLGVLLKVVTLGILSMGIFTLLLDAILILVADYFLKGLSVKNFWWALALAAVVAIIDGLFSWIL